MACVPLLPFANRIAGGRFSVGGREIILPRLPGEAHALHGDGWLSAWQVASAEHDHAILTFDHPAAEWPWHYAARQDIRIVGDGYDHAFSLINLGDTPMPAGLGLHPWLPCTPATTYHGLHRDRWRMGNDNLPCALSGTPGLRDWWDGAPVPSQTIDTCFTGRVGDLTIRWPDRGLGLAMTPSPNLSFTHIYVPAGADFFCVEPVSHAPDAIHRPGEAGMLWLAPGARLTAMVKFRVFTLPAH